MTARPFLAGVLLGAVLLVVAAVRWVYLGVPKSVDALTGVTR